MQPRIVALIWDEWNQEKLWQKHLIEAWEVEEVVFDDDGAEFRWYRDQHHGRRLLVRGRTHEGQTLFIVLDPVDPDEGIWRCRTAWEVQK